MWQKVLNNAKLIVSSVVMAFVIVTGAWTVITNTFVTVAKAELIIAKYDIEISYNKAFRIESRIRDIEKNAEGRDLSVSEKRELNRLKSNLNRVDFHIKKYESKNKIGQGIDF